MRHPFLLTGQLTFTTALLGAALTSCAVGAKDPGGATAGAADGLSGGGGFGGENMAGGDQSNGEQSAGSSGGGNPAGGNQGGGNQAGGNGTGSGNQGGGNQGGSNSTGGSNQGGGNQAGGDPGGDPGEGQGLFEAPNPWTKNVSAMEADADSDAIINWLDQHGGWGAGALKIDFGITVLEADDSTPKKSFTPTDEFYSPDCDEVPFPVPAGGALEGEQNYSCSQDGDCHLIVVQKSEKKLYEMWRANMSGGAFYGGCAAVWDLTKAYPENLRGEGCTSADAGGFPIAAMLFSPEEVQAGAVNHAIRFILPNNRIRKNIYVHPGTHSTFATSGGANAPPYGVRFRLRKDFPLESLPSDGARVIAKAIQTYGMFLSDGGNIALTGKSDQLSSVKWSDLDVDSLSLSGIHVSDMEVVDMGELIDWSKDCVRNE
jgi:hypothetical protein